MERTETLEPRRGQREEQKGPGPSTTVTVVGRTPAQLRLHGASSERGNLAAASYLFEINLLILFVLEEEETSSELPKDHHRCSHFGNPSVHSFSVFIWFSHCCNHPVFTILYPTAFIILACICFCMLNLSLLLQRFIFLYIFTHKGSLHGFSLS